MKRFVSIIIALSISVVVSFAQGNKELDLVHKTISVSYSLSDLNRVKDILIKYDLETKIPIAHPLKGNGWISSPFGPRKHPITRKTKYHTGVDIAVEFGTAVFCTADGIVDFAGKKGGYGRCIIIKHEFGFSTIYAHLSAYYVTKESIVRKGQLIGFVGSTGMSTGNHLHYEVRKFRRPIKPLLE